ncbi:hypothetical protein BTJ39_23170 [Izhakiella australiensis]|uniref:Uncharacterized protein n=1 Tax=Izhakiella australiensis TaxID=1926881 RepID=A0A1S8Y7I1_9GAMM|nr:hypothetical protein [Izhakiella australiensis]OON34768.1 hypothetical protein BTJ39_23170 [Izhakiella australiensis]
MTESEKAGLVEYCKEEIAHLERCVDMWPESILMKMDLHLRQISLASLTAEPAAYAHRLVNKHSGVTHPWLYGGAERSPSEGDIFRIEVNKFYSDPPAPAVSAGWKLVPVELLENLRSAAHFEKSSYVASFGSHIDVGRWKNEFDELSSICTQIDKLLAATPEDKC